MQRIETDNHKIRRIRSAYIYLDWQTVNKFFLNRLYKYESVKSIIQYECTSNK